MDVDKVTLKSEPVVHRISASQTEQYNWKYPHLAYEVRHAFGAKISFASMLIHLDKFLSIYP